MKGQMKQARRSRWKIVAAVMSSSLGLGICGAMASGAPTTQPAVDASSLAAENAALAAKVEALEAKVDKFQATQEASQTDQATTMQQIVSGADQQSQFLSTTFLPAGYDPAVGYVVRSEDGQFSLHPGVVMDFRYMADYRERIPAGGGGETDAKGYSTENGFDLSRFRITLDGNFTKNITYFVQLQDDQGAGFGLLDAYWVYHLPDNSPFAVKVGQFKDPVWHERNLSEATLLTVDRSEVESLLGGGQTSRVEGISFMYDQDRLRAQGVIHNGFDSLNSKFYDTGGLGAGVGGGAGVTPTDYGASTRVEYLLLGDRTADSDPYREYDHGFTALNDKQDILVAGGGADFSQGGANSVLFHTGDLQYDTASGFSAYAAYLGSYRYIHDNQGVPRGVYYDPGALIQAAYLVTPKIEPFIRYDYTYIPQGSTTGLLTGEVQEITIGANYYLYKQNVKFTVDGSWLPNGAPGDNDALGILKVSGRNEIVLRAQFQLAL